MFLPCLRTKCQDPSCVDWDRLAKPRKTYPPPAHEIKPVRSAALQTRRERRREKIQEIDDENGMMKETEEEKKRMRGDGRGREQVSRTVTFDMTTLATSNTYSSRFLTPVLAVAIALALITAHRERNVRSDIKSQLKPIRRLWVGKCDVKDARILLRCDLDFTKGKPIDCKIADVLPTMQMILNKGAKSLVIISRCGPEGIPKDPEYSLKPLAQVFEQNLGTRVIFLDDCVGFQAQALCEDPVPGSVFLLENLAFHPEEVGYVMVDDQKVVCKKDEVNRFQRIVSDHGDIYVTDAFTELVHMTNTTIGYPPKEFAYGFNIKKELAIFHKFALQPPVPVLAIVAGAFDRTWMVIRNFMGKVSDILIGGQVAYILLKAIKGISIGNTKCTSRMEKKALKLFSRAKDTQTLIHLPSDVIVQDVNSKDYFVALTREDIDDWFEIVDIGPHTRQCYTKTIRDASAIIWMGEFGPLSDGTEVIKAAYVQAATAGTPTYAADDFVKNFFSSMSQPEECLFVTGDGDATENLLRGHIPTGLAVLSKSRRKVKREPIPDEKSTKPTAYELPGMIIPGGTKPGVSYGASHSLLCINHIPIENLKVLVRVEFNEPMTNDYTVSNNYRMRMTIPTIKYALKWRARAVIVLAHFRDPQGRRDPELSLKPICDEMSNLLGETNVRFSAEEEHGFLHLQDGRTQRLDLLKNPSQVLPSGYTAETNSQFCEQLSRLGDIFVNDAFAALHLDHASITGNLRPTRVCGFLVKNELKYLAKLLNYPQRKFLVILGGTNIEEKLDLIPGILKEADSLILAGTMAILFLKVEYGLKTGRMAFTEKLQNWARSMIEIASYYKCRFHYPVDLAVSTEPDGKTTKQVSVSEGIPDGYLFVDIGELSASMFTRIIKRKSMIFWTGTTGNGRLEYEKSCTKQLMDALHTVTHDPEKGAVTIVGGRGLSQIVEKYDPEHESFTHLTTGGRTALQLLAKRHVIGLDILLPKPGKRPLSLMGVTDYNEFRDAVVIVRCDLDLPLDPDEDLTVDTYPLQPLVETIKYIQKQKAKAVVLISQRGNPMGEVDESLSLEPIRPLLETLLDQNVIWAPNALILDEDTHINNVEKGDVILTENVGFHPEETGYMKTEGGTWIPVSHEDIAKFRTRLRLLGGVFVNESFASLHRPYSSVVGIHQRPCLAGLNLKKQVYDYVDIRRQLDGDTLLIMGCELYDDIFHYFMILYNALDIVEQVFLCGNMAAAFRSASSYSSVKEFRDAHLVIPR
ncbi:phosphoglycerate kinase [Plakobranchus ocellatus]|uniref:Phosphoglycerate kinase n=1 Tax=Plakobranchus ocellatus TaxID=259542 RepID=A0AAV3Z4A2_9GAST|nr:phosphoglycerate kinase [Plakobranchus ocellatus]